MAALPIVPKTLRVAVLVEDAVARELVSRFFITYTGTAPTNAQLNTFCTAVATAWGSDLKSLHTVEKELNEVTAVDLSSATAAEGVASPAISGTLSAAILPADAAFVISYEVQRRYRGGHARGYWPFGAATSLNDNATFTGAFVTLVGTGWAAFIAAVEAAGWSGAGTLTHSNVSFYNGFTVITSPTTGRARNVPTPRLAAVIDQVTGYVYRSRVGSQRRRVRA